MFDFLKTWDWWRVVFITMFVLFLIQVFGAVFYTAKAATPAQRPSILKYYLCLANPTVIDKTKCHL